MGGLGYVGLGLFTLKPNEFMGAFRALPSPCLVLQAWVAGMELEEAILKGQKHSKARTGDRCCAQAAGCPALPKPRLTRVRSRAAGDGLVPPVPAPAGKKPELLPSLPVPAAVSPRPKTGDFAPLGL